MTGGLLIAYGLRGFLWPFVPMHLRETLAASGTTSSDTTHIALGVLTEILYLLALGLAAVSLGQQFRLYSIITFMMLETFGILTPMDAGDVGGKSAYTIHRCLGENQYRCVPALGNCTFLNSFI